MKPLRIAVVEIGWWSDVLADAAAQSFRYRDLHARPTSARPSRQNTVARRPTATTRSCDASIEAIINTTPNNASQSPQAAAGLARVSRQADRQYRCGRFGDRASAKNRPGAGLGYQRRRESHSAESGARSTPAFRQAGTGRGNISRDRLGQIDLTSWRYQASGMPGGVMLQIGIHYVDVLEFLMGPVKRVSGMSNQLVLPGDNPDVANLILEHDSGAISNLTASYASASEYYMMNIYGKEATAYYDLFNGLRHLKRGEKKPQAIATEKNDAIREELDEFVECVRNKTKPETDGFWATRNLAVLRAGARSAREGRAVEVSDVLASGE
jgi:hypothetical protein